MLLGYVEGLLEDGHEVWVVARRPPALEHPRLHALCVDYGDAVALEEALAGATGTGPSPTSLFDGAIVWAHRSAPHVPEVVAGHVAGPTLQVLGSASADPSRQPAREQTRPDAGRPHRTVVLGFVREAGTLRWLTNEEIRAGVLQAWGHGAERSVVGTVRPWSARP